MKLVSQVGPLDRQFTFEAGELAVLQSALKTKLFAGSGGSASARLAKLQTLVNGLSGAFAVPTLTLELRQSLSREEFSGSRYTFQPDLSSGRAELGKLSLLSVLGAFGKHLGAMENGRVSKSYAKAFARSLYRAAAPGLYGAAQVAGTVPYGTAEERYTAEAVALLTSLGWTLTAPVAPVVVESTVTDAPAS